MTNEMWIGVAGVGVALIGLYLGWLNSRFNRIHDEMQAIIKDMDAKAIALSARIDSDNVRIDKTQAILMRLVENIGKTK